VRAVQTLGHAVTQIGPGNRVALNLAGIEHGELGRGDAVVTPGRWRPTDRFDASLTVLGTLDHVVSRRGAYLAYIGSGEHAVRLRVLGPDTIMPGATGAVRLHLPVALPLLPGDRYVLRESGRDETVGGGEVLDVAPVLPASRARPDRRVERVVAEHGWVDADELEALTGTRVAPNVGRWVVDPDVAVTSADALRERLAAGVELADLDEQERALLGTVADAVVDGTRARLGDTADPLAAHPVIAGLAAGGLAPPEPDAAPADLRELARRGVLFEREGLWWHIDALAAASEVVAALVAGDGFTVSEFRESAGITRKHAIPLLTELDARGITRRRGDRRIAGPRLTPSDPDASARRG
jgi:selenocysteine-specific elongation factor